MKNIRNILSENFHFLVGNFSVYLNRHVFVMYTFQVNRIHKLLSPVESVCMKCKSLFSGIEI